MRALLKAYEWIIVALATIAGVIIAVTFFVVVLDAATRNLGLPTIHWAVPFSEFGLLYVTLLAAPWLLRVKRQVVVESVRVYLPTRVRRVLEIAVYIGCIVICAIVIWFAADQAVDAWRRGDVEQRGIALPLYLAYVPFVISFFFMGFEFARLLYTGQTLYTMSATVKEES